MGHPQKPQTSEKKANSTQDQHGTKQSPLIEEVTPSPNTEKDAAATEQEKNERAAEQRRTENLTIVNLVAAGIQAVALIWTICVMVRTARRQLRAYMSCKVVGPSNIDSPHFSVQAIMENAGQTPAHAVHWWCELLPYRHPLPVGFKFQSAPVTLLGPRTVVHPGGNQHHGNIRPDVPLTDEQKTAIHAGSMGLYVWGEIRYKDVFKKNRKTTFRCLWEYRAGPTHGHWKYCDEGNEAN